jgi:tetratricopeptide (TPR) repeat protein
MRAISFFLFVALATAQSDPLLSGLQAFHRGDYAAAERSFRESLQKGPDPRARAFLALTLAATGRCQAARADLAQAFASSADDVRRLAGLALAQCDISEEKWEDAAGVLRKLRDRFPSDADVLYESARLYMRAWNDVIYDLYQKAPASFRVDQISAEILETQGHYPEAAAEYRKAIEKSPATLGLHFGLGRALLLSSHDAANLDAAAKEFQAELALNPADATCYYELAQVLLAEHKSADAAGRLGRAVELDPNFAEALVALGKLRLEDKKYDDAIGLLERAVKLAPQSEPAHYNLMMAYRNAGKMAEARREKTELDKLQKTPEGEFTDFLKKLGDKAPGK